MQSSKLRTRQGWLFQMPDLVPAALAVMSLGFHCVLSIPKLKEEKTVFHKAFANEERGA